MILDTGVEPAGRRCNPADAQIVRAEGDAFEWVVLFRPTPKVSQAPFLKPADKEGGGRHGPNP